MQTYFNIRIFTFLAILEYRQNLTLYRNIFKGIKYLQFFLTLAISVTWGVSQSTWHIFTVKSFYSICQDFVGAEQEGEISL